jgi:hypothetical protein
MFSVSSTRCYANSNNKGNFLDVNHLDFPRNHHDTLDATMIPSNLLQNAHPNKLLNCTHKPSVFGDNCNLNMEQAENIENLFEHEAFRKQTSPHTRVVADFRRGGTWRISGSLENLPNTNYHI